MWPGLRASRTIGRISFTEHIVLELHSRNSLFCVRVARALRGTLGQGRINIAGQQIIEQPIGFPPFLSILPRQANAGRSTAIGGVCVCVRVFVH